MKGLVCFYRESPGTPYDPITGTGGSVDIDILWSGKARIQQLRAPQEFENGYEVSATRFFHFQIDPSEPGNPIPTLTEGVKARVVDGARDLDLESLGFVVSSAINSSDRAVRTVKTSSNMRSVDWQWELVDGVAVF